MCGPWRCDAEPIFGASYKHGYCNASSHRAGHDLRQLRAQRRTETVVHSRSTRCHRRPGRRSGHGGIRIVSGQARGLGRGDSSTGIRSAGMSVTAPERVDLPVSGMTCAACARTIERTLAHTRGVERAHVNFATSTATVEYDPGQVRVGDFIGAIEDLGYGVAESEAPANGEAIRYRRR